MSKTQFNRVLLYTLAVCGVAADQATKYGMFSWLAGVPGNRYVLFRTTPEADDELHGFALVAQFERSNDGRHEVLTDAHGRPIPHVNHGALFGILRDHKTPANLGFAFISLAAAAAIIWWSTQRATAGDRWLCAALGLILAGTLGNLYDRILFNGVRDFFHWDYLYNWPVFNVADCCLVTGAGLLLLQAFAKETAKSPTADARPQSATRSETPFPQVRDAIRA
jgi:lipoprotein signal peptidase